MTNVFSIAQNRSFRLWTVILPALFSCRGNAPAPPYVVSLAVQSEPGKPLAGAVVSRDGAALGKTGADGRARFELQGQEGEVFAITVGCPADHSAPPPLRVPLRRLAEGSPEPSYTLTCAPEKRTVVVAVRAENGANLPVIYLGREIARTDASGAAHARLSLRPGERFELTLATDGSEKKLVPQNPSAAFVANDHDEVLVFNQAFTSPKPRAGAGKRRAAGPQPF